MKQNNLSVVLRWVAAASLGLAGTAAFLAPEISLLWQVLLGLGVISFAITGWLGRTGIQKSLAKRSTRYGLNSAFMSLVVFGIVILVNMIAVNYDVKTDVTKNKIHTLSDQTIKVLKGLSQEITLKVFVTPAQIQEFTPVLDKYTFQSKQLKKQFIDVDRDPLEARKNDIKQSGTVLVVSSTRTARVEGVSSPQDPRFEEKLTNALVQVVKGEKKKIYFMTGHGERMMNDATREGYSGMRDALSASRFAVEELLLLEKGKVPTDAEIIIIAGPRKSFMPQELTELEAYLKNGGKVFLMVDPESPPSLQPFLAKYGVVWKENKAVLETNPLQALANGNQLAPIVKSYDASHEITKEARQVSLFAIATPVEKAEKAPEGMVVTSLFSTSKQSREATLSREGATSTAKDRVGPFSLAVAVNSALENKADPKEGEAKPPEFRMVVVGDSDFGNNSLRAFGMNSDLFQNMLSWLSKEEDLISIRPKTADEGSFDITQQRMRVIFFASVFFLPFLMFASGISVWIARKRM